MLLECEQNSRKRWDAYHSRGLLLPGAASSQYSPQDGLHLLKSSVHDLSGHVNWHPQSVSSTQPPLLGQHCSFVLQVAPHLQGGIM